MPTFPANIEKGIKAVTTNLQKGDQDDKEFERRLKIAQTMLKEKELDLKANNQG